MRLRLTLLHHRYGRPSFPSAPPLRRLRSVAALEAIGRAADERTPVVALYNYPSFSSAFSTLFAHLYHAKLNLPCLVLPFSSVVTLRVDDLCFEGLKTCYFLDFIGPKEFSVGLSRMTACEIVWFDHRTSALSELPHSEETSEKLKFHVDLQKSSSRVVYEYFSSKLKYVKSTDENSVANTLVDTKNHDHVELLLKYLKDGDLR